MTVAFSAVHSINSVPKGPENEENEDKMDLFQLQKPPVTPMLVEVSLVTTVVRPMSGLEWEKAMDLLKEFKNFVTGTIDKGKALYDKHETKIEKAKAVFKMIEGVGDIYSGIMKLQPEEEDPMVKMLADLTSEVKRLGRKLSENFAELKVFITEQDFYLKITNPTTVLLRYWADCLETPGEDSKEAFREAYRNMKPLKMQYNLAAYLSQRATNPLQMNMDKKMGKSKATFDEWADKYYRIMDQYLMLEGFASGLLGIKSETNKFRLMDSLLDVYKAMDSWREEYKRDQGYWSELKAFFVPYMKDRTYLTNTEKAKELKEKLEDYLTNDALYLVIFDRIPDGEHAYYCPDEQRLLLTAWDKGWCNCFIYRSCTAYQRQLADYQQIRSFVINHGNLQRDEPYDTLLETLYNESKSGDLRHCGFLFWAPEELSKIQVHFLNSLEPESVNRGPGHFGPVRSVNNGRERFVTMIAGFE